MKWITRDRPKIDRLACPWLIKKFVDPEAEFYYVPYELVLAKAEELDAIPYDIPGVEYTHYDNRCTFDYFVQKHQIEDPAVHTVAHIVRAADTDRHDLASQASGLWAITAGLAYNIKDDAALLEVGMTIYDALYSWATHLKDHKHTQNPTEGLLIEVYRKFLKQKQSAKKTPEWVKELKAIIQEQVDMDLSLSLQEISESLQIHPAYLSRKFSEYFDNMNFGEYMRKLRIQKAVTLLETTEYSLAEIALLTGFSDQSHFTRNFKSHLGMPPHQYRRYQSKRTKK